MHEKLCDLSLSIFTTFFTELLEKIRHIIMCHTLKIKFTIDKVSFNSLTKVTQSDELKNNSLIVANRLLKAAKQEYLAHRGNDIISDSNVGQYL